VVPAFWVLQDRSHFLIVRSGEFGIGEKWRQVSARLAGSAHNAPQLAALSVAQLNQVQVTDRLRKRGSTEMQNWASAG